MPDHAQREVETALRDPFENDARHGPHLPDLWDSRCFERLSNWPRPLEATKNSEM